MVNDFDSRRLHEIVVELLVELMEHAISHAEDDDVWRSSRSDAPVRCDAFVEQYRDERNFDGRSDTAIWTDCDLST